jgi:Bacterial Ig domain
VNWDTTQVQNGTHWLAAQYTNSSGIIGTSAVVTVNVANSSTTSPTVTITDPAAGSTVNAVITLAATVASTNPINNVQFYVDGGAVGAALTAPPYNTFWDTETYAAGTHTITATATDSFGNLGNAAPVSVTVDNSNPPRVIGIDAQVFTDGVGIMTSPAFSTTTNSDLLVAFVALDGPSSSPQSATVSGAGLTWTLLKRSNTQAGDAEIWAAKATDFLTNATVIMQPGVGSSYHGSLVVLAYTNAAGPGIVGQAAAPSGAPDIYLPGVSAGNWVFAVGNDWDNAIARTPVSGQYLVHQRVDTSVGDTYWVQSTTAPSPAYALVDIHDSSPTSDRWNYCAVEIVATRQ